MRILLFSGLADRAQSATALATAAYAATTGMRVLVASTGPTHRLSALIDIDVSGRIQEVMPGLKALELHILDAVGDRWDGLRQTMRSGFTGRFRDITRDELPSFAGIDEVGALFVIEDALESGEYDLVVIDGPSIDSLLRSVALPDSLRWLIRLIFGLDRGPGRSRSSQDSALLPMAIMPPNMSAPLQDLRVNLEQQRARLDAETGARVRLVLPSTEAPMPSLRQSLCGLGLYGLAVDMVMLRGAATEVDADTHAMFGATYRESRPPLLINDLALHTASPQDWATRGAQLYSEQEDGITLPPVLGTPPSIERRELRLAVPFLDGDSLDVALASEEVVVRLGQFRRHLLMPALLSGGKLRARIEGEILRLWVE